MAAGRYRIGLRAHDFGRLPAEDLAAALRPFHPDIAQLALSKALPDPPGEEEYLKPRAAASIRSALAEKGVSVSVLGCYINPVHPNPGERERQLQRFEAHLKRAGDFGCRIVGTETGSPAPDSSRHPGRASEDSFELLCESLARLAGVAERLGAVVGVEPVADIHVLSSFEKTARLLDRIPGPGLGIIFDPVNLMPIAGLAEPQSDFFERAFDCLGSRIAAIHLKDFLPSGRESGGKGGKGTIVALGRGAFDLGAFLESLVRRFPSMDLLLENCGPGEAAASMRALRQALGVSPGESI